MSAQRLVWCLLACTLLDAGVAQAQAPKAIAINTVDAVGNVGFSTSIAIGSDGQPVVSYQDRTNGNLKVVKCGNAACSSGNTITTVDASGRVGPGSSIAIGANGLPVISYQYFNGGFLLVAECGNAACSSGNTNIAVDTAPLVGTLNSIAVPADGLPVISYYDAFNGDLKVTKCGNAACFSANNTITTVDTVGDVGQYTSIAIGADELPVISYYNVTNKNLKVAKCGNATCSLGNTITTVDTGGVGEFTSIAVPADGLPVISYFDNTDIIFFHLDLKVVKCGNAACSSGNTITAVDTSGFVGQHTSIKIGADGLPVISYFDASNGHLNVAKCGNAACSSGNTIIAVDTAVGVGEYTSIAIGTDGLPVISYYDATNGDLKVAKFLAAKVRRDFNGDGKADILWRRDDGLGAIWFMNGAANTPALLGLVPTSWTIAGVGDFNGDGKADILWRNNTDGNVAIWLMNGIVSSPVVLGLVPTSWRIAGVGDFDGDGKDDILWRRDDGLGAIWFSANASTSALLGLVPTNWTIAGVGDFDGDGKADILWRRDDGLGAIWFMNGSTPTPALLGLVPTNWTISSH